MPATSLSFRTTKEMDPFLAGDGDIACRVKRLIRCENHAYIISQSRGLFFPIWSVGTITQRRVMLKT